MQKAVINCVREAYVDADPNKVNGKVPPLQNSFVPASEIVEFQNMAGLSTLTNVIGGDQAVMFWGKYRDSRPPEKRVPIHVHPLGGYTLCEQGPGGDGGSGSTYHNLPRWRVLQHASFFYEDDPGTTPRWVYCH